MGLNKIKSTWHSSTIYKDISLVLQNSLLTCLQYMLSKDLGTPFIYPFKYLMCQAGPVRDADDTEKNGISVLPVSRQIRWWYNRATVLWVWGYLLEVPKALRPSLHSPLVTGKLEKGKKFYLERVVLLAPCWPLPIEIWQPTPQPPPLPSWQWQILKKSLGSG